METSTIALTHRQLQILTMLAVGYSNKELAERLNLGIRTIETHIEKILDRTNSVRRTEAACKYIRNPQKYVVRSQLCTAKPVRERKLKYQPGDISGKWEIIKHLGYKQRDNSFAPTYKNSKGGYYQCKCLGCDRIKPVEVGTLAKRGQCKMCAGKSHIWR